jgi:hypothetical protein
VGLGFALLVVGVALSSLPAYYTLLMQRLCSGDACRPGQLTAEELQALHAVGLSRRAFAVVTVGYNVLTAVGFFTVAVVLLWRTAGWYPFLVALVFLGVGLSFPTVGVWGRSPALDQLVAVAWAAPLPVVCLFPNGRFVPRYTRLLVPAWTGSVLAAMFVPATPLNPLLGGLWLVGCWAGTLGAQIYRYRRVSGPVERQQAKWVIVSLLAAISGAFGMVALGLLIPALHQPGPARALYGLLTDAIITLLLLLIPLAVGSAILRYGLYDIDVIINRTLVYGTLTVTLALVYFGSVLGLQRLLSIFLGQLQDSPLILVASTLAVAALVQPLRRRIQAGIDRRFYRRKYNATRTLQAFSATLRDEVDLNRLTAELLTVVEETMQPAHVSVWIRNVPAAPAAGGPVDSRPVPAAPPQD